MKVRKFLIKAAVWSITEIVFNLNGLDDLADYSEFVFEQNWAKQEKQITLIENSLMATPRNSRFGKKKLPDPQEVSASPQQNVLQLLPRRQTQSPSKTKLSKKQTYPQIIFQLAKLNLLQVLPWAGLCGGYGFLISLLDRRGLLPPILHSSAIVSLVTGLSLVVGLLLVLRINVARKYLDKGYKLWNATLDTVLNTVRGICLYIDEYEPQDQYEKESAINLVSAFIIIMKLHLRGQPITEVKPLVSQLEYKRLQVSHHPPLDIVFWLGDYFKRQYQQERLNTFQLSYLQCCTDEMLNIVGDCERVAKTSGSSVSSKVQNILLIVYTTVLPLAIVNGLGWATGAIVFLVSWIYLSANHIRGEMERPFNNQYINTYLDAICGAVGRDIDKLMQQKSQRQPRIPLDLPQKAA